MELTEEQQVTSVVKSSSLLTQVDKSLTTTPKRDYV